MIVVFVDQERSLSFVMVKSKKQLHAVVGVVFDANTNKVLVSKRRENQSYPGYWELPGGKIETGETSVIALTRELFEEIDITIITAEYIITLYNDYPEHQVKLDAFKVISYHGVPTGKEGQNIEWIAVAKLPKLKPILPGSSEIIKLIK
jgi:8-oxo-dGTP diphosphatase